MHPSPQLHIQTLDFHFFDSRPTGKILSRIIGDINSLKDVLSNCVTTLIQDRFRNKVLSFAKARHEFPFRQSGHCP